MTVKKSLLAADRSLKLNWHAQGARDAFRILADIVLAPPFPLTSEGLREYCFFKAAQEDPLFLKMEATFKAIAAQGKQYSDYVAEKVEALGGTPK